MITAVAGSLGGPRRLNEATLIGGLSLTFVLCLATAGQFLGGTIPTAFDNALRVDGLSALVLVLCGFVGWLSGLYGVGYLRRNEAGGFLTPRMLREFHGLVPAYVFAMLLVSVSNNLGILWIAVELTTLASVFLVAFHNRDTSLEAAWKFLVLGSLGLGFALLGTVLLFASAQGRLGDGMSALEWTRFMQVAPSLHPFTLRLGVVFALLALLLAASGLYAVVSYATSQRVKEFGVRVALGAVPADITRMMLRQTGVLVAIGLVLGLAGGRLLAMGATALLYRVSPSDPVTYAGVAVTLGAVALLASYVPVRRATAIDPVQALRLE